MKRKPVHISKGVSGEEILESLGIENLVQLHHQYKDGTTKFCSQTNNTSHKKFRKFVFETEKKYPIPAGAIWLACNEDSKHFIKTHKDQSKINWNRIDERP